MSRHLVWRADASLSPVIVSIVCLSAENGVVECLLELVVVLSSNYPGCSSTHRMQAVLNIDLSSRRYCAAKSCHILHHLNIVWPTKCDVATLIVVLRDRHMLWCICKMHEIGCVA